MAVCPSERRCGLATRLLEAAEAQALVWGQNHLVLHVYGDNAPAVWEGRGGEGRAGTPAYQIRCFGPCIAPVQHIAPVTSLSLCGWQRMSAPPSSPPPLLKVALYERHPGLRQVWGDPWWRGALGGRMRRLMHKRVEAGGAGQ